MLPSRCIWNVLLNLFILGLSRLPFSLCLSGKKLDWEKDSIQLTGHVRNYLTGPIEGKMAVTKYDVISLYAGELPENDPSTPTKIHIRKWLLWGDADDPESLCYLQRIYDYGRKAAFLCPLVGTYLAFAKDEELDASHLEATPPIEAGPSDKPEKIWATRASILHFELSQRGAMRGTKGNYYTKFMKDNRELWLNPKSGQTLTQSDPLDFIDSDYCYYWNYRMREKARVGYVFRESEPLTGVASSGSYILVELSVWIMETSSVTESERNTAASDVLIISEYSKVLTRRFHSKGLLPCLRKVHPSVELVTEITFFEIDADLKSPHWRIELKVHTDTLISTLSDVSFTVSSRQHVSLFHCFVGDVRIFMRNQDFDFIDAGQNDRNSISWGLSVVPPVTLDYVRLKIKHIYGHGTVYIGQSLSRAFQPGDVRTDMEIINNPCVAQEFAMAFAGRIYIVEEFLINYEKNAIDIVLPGLGDYDADDGVGNPETERNHGKYLSVADVAFTPTHIALLMLDSNMYIHSHSIYYRGFAYLATATKYKLGALVKRRWCSRTGTPKSHNMIVPAYSRTGNIIIVQMYPAEGSVNMWVKDPPESCLFRDPTLFTTTLSDIEKRVNETCVHRDELVKHSDDRGLDEFPDIKECDNNPNIRRKSNETKVVENPDEMQSFLMNDDALFDEDDLHFPRELTNVAIHKISDNSTFYNYALTYMIDHQEKDGRKVESLLKDNGFNLISQNILHAVEFTAVEKMFIIGSEFRAKEFDSSNAKYDFTMLVTSITAVNMPVKIYATSADVEEKLDTSIPFPGVILVRTVPYMVKNLEDDKGGAVSYTTKLFAINTALPAYVIDFGNVYVFSSVESKYARPLSFFDREMIHSIIRNNRRDPATRDPSIPDKLLAKFRKPTFSPENYTCTTRDCPNPATDLFDIVVTEQGTVSVLSRPKVVNGKKVEEGQRAFIGSVYTLDSLREVRPFSRADSIFQQGTPDGEIVYGKFKARAFPYHAACTKDQQDDIDKGVPLQSSCLIPHKVANVPPYCVRPEDDVPIPECLPWKFVNADEKSGTPPSNNVIGKCKPPCTGSSACVCQAGTSVDYLPPESFPSMELDSAEILSVPFQSLLNGNLQTVHEEKIGSSKPITNSNKAAADDLICPFSSFDVKYVKFDYAEIGFRTRITGVISYLGKNVPSEAELIIEYENVPGIQVTITSGVVEEKDQTTLSKTIDIMVKLSDIDFRKMRTSKIRTKFRDTTNLAREISDLFSITIRPSIINLRCSKEDFFITIQCTIGCNPFNRMRLVAEASPLVKRKVNHENEKASDIQWQRKGDDLYIPRDSVWHKQRAAFGCDQKTQKKCKIPYAYLFEDNIYDLSWRDPFVPQFEQFLRSHTRRVSGNVIVYDLLGHEVVMNTTTLAAGCFHSANNWYTRLLESTKKIGIDTTEQEDAYHYFDDCFDQSQAIREQPLTLSTTVYRPINLTNFNRLRFDISSNQPNQNRTKNRNQIFVFRATVINTYFNRFTYCKLMNTFFLIRVTGIPAPRKGLSYARYAILFSVLFVCLISIYLVFAYCYVWKLDMANVKTSPGDVEVGNDDLEEGEDDHEKEKRLVREAREKFKLQSAAIKLQALSRFRATKADRVNKPPQPQQKSPAKSPAKKKRK